MTKIRTIVLSLGLCAGSTLALAQGVVPVVTFQDQTRSITATTADGVGVNSLAPDFGPFVAIVERTVPVTVGGQEAINRAVASISCTLDGDGVKVGCRLSGGGAGGGGGPVVAGTASTLVDATFNLPVDFPFTLVGSALDFGPAADNTATVTLTNAQTNQIIYTNGRSAFEPISISLDLPAAQYRFVVELELSSSASLSEREYEFELSPFACEADLDDGSMDGHEDGAVDINDLLYFVDVFAQGDNHADLDDGTGTGHRDHAVDINDLLFFLDHFQVGC
ncbi:MAG: GC-type dockerin domain-anchored protein [Phycisphaerales bacterium]